MTYRTGEKTGLIVEMDQGDLEWTNKFQATNQEWENRVSKTTAADPNGSVAGNYYGQSCWSTGRGILFECIRPGPAVGTARALWAPRDYVAVGTFCQFVRTSLPTGYLPFTGLTYSGLTYPALFAVLPDGIAKTGTTFTLPNLNDTAVWLRTPTNAQPVGDNRKIGTLNEAKTAGGTFWGSGIFNVIFGIKF